MKPNSRTGKVFRLEIRGQRSQLAAERIPVLTVKEYLGTVIEKQERRCKGVQKGIVKEKVHEKPCRFRMVIEALDVDVGAVLESVSGYEL
jgi:hypothetical protein